MGVAIYINDRNKRARVHEDDCKELRKNKGGRNGYYKYFECYEDAWDYLEEYFDNYDCDDCYYCEPNNESCYDEDDDEYY